MDGLSSISGALGLPSAAPPPETPPPESRETQQPAPPQEVITKTEDQGRTVDIQV